MTTLRKRVVKLYHPPFRFDAMGGYIWDSKGEMVADFHLEENGQVLQIRGWGRLKYMKDAEKLQDEIGNFIAEILTNNWPK